MLGLTIILYLVALAVCVIGAERSIQQPLMVDQLAIVFWGAAGILATVIEIALIAYLW